MGFSAWVNRVLIAINFLVYIFITFPLSFKPVDPQDPALAEYLKFLIPQLPEVARPPRVPMRDIVGSLDAYSLFVFEHGFKPAAQQLTDLFASLFLHAGFAHLVGNMLFLWIYGNNVEHRLGRLGYLLAYLATGVIATETFAWVAGPSMAPLVGASGAISGVLGLYFVMFPKNKVRLVFALTASIILVPARVVLAIYVLFENLLPQLAGASSNVAYGAHLGGFVGGFLIAVVGEKVGWRWPWATPKPDQPQRPERAASVPSESLSMLEFLRGALARRDDAHVLSYLRHLTEVDLMRLRGGELVELARVLSSVGHADEAMRTLRQYLAAHPRGPDASIVLFALGLERLATGQVIAAHQHFLAALEAGPTPDLEIQIRELLSRIPIARP